MQPVSQLDQIVLNVRALQGQRVLVGIDGLDGVGKSTLAKELATRLGAKLVGLDAYLIKNAGSFLDAIRYDALRTDLESPSTPLIVEGVCLQEVLGRCGVHADYKIYVRRLSQTGLWHDENLCSPTEPPDVLKSRELEFRRDWSSVADGDDERPVDLGLFGELIDYHAKFRPTNTADTVYDVHDKQSER